MSHSLDVTLNADWSALAPAGFSVFHHQELGSTNDEALRLANQGALQSSEGIWVIADKQTKGRGRQARVWSSESGNFAASAALPAGQLSAFQAYIPFAVAVAIGDALAPYLRPNAALAYKWPNDILVNDKKISGVLIEAVSSGQGLSALIVGIGINRAFAPSNTLFPATYLAECCVPGGLPLLTELFKDVTHSLSKLLLQLQSGYERQVLEAWRAKAWGMGTVRTITEHSTSYEARLIRLEDDGALIVEKINSNGDTTPRTSRVYAADVF